MNGVTKLRLALGAVIVGATAADLVVSHLFWRPR